MRISDWSSDVCSSDLYHVELAEPAGIHEAGSHEISGARLRGNHLSLRIGNRARAFTVLDREVNLLVHDGERRLRLQPLAMYRHEQGAAGAGADNVVAPMPGRVVVVKAATGEALQAGPEAKSGEASGRERWGRYG